MLYREMSGGVEARSREPQRPAPASRYGEHRATACRNMRGGPQPCYALAQGARQGGWTAQGLSLGTSKRVLVLARTHVGVGLVARRGRRARAAQGARHTRLRMKSARGAARDTLYSSSVTKLSVYDRTTLVDTCHLLARGVVASVGCGRCRWAPWARRRRACDGAAHAGATSVRRRVRDSTLTRLSRSSLSLYPFESRRSRTARRSCRRSLGT